MKTPALDFGRAAPWLMLIGIWTIPTLIGGALALDGLQKQGIRVAYWRTVIWIAPFWFLWALATPIVFRLGEILPLDAAEWRRNAALHFGLAGAFAAVHLLGAVAALRALNPVEPPYPFWTSYVGSVKRYFEYDFLLYGAVLGSGYALRYYRRYRRSAFREASLRTQLADANLLALKTQLQPHFLFNTLHSISSLMGEDVAAARRMLARLGDLLRHTLQSESLQEVTVSDELESLRLYLDIERERFSDRLSIGFMIDEAALNAMVPNLVLQPLVENAVRHGIAPSRRGGRIEIEARTDGDVLRLRVSDDGLGGRALLHEGIGLRNTRSRLEHLYGRRQEFRVMQPAAGGFVVELAFPHRETASATSPLEGTGVAPARSRSGEPSTSPAGGSTMG